MPEKALSLRMNHSHTGKGESQNRNVIFLAELLCSFGNLFSIARCGEELSNACEPEELACDVPCLKQAVCVESKAITAAHTHLDWLVFCIRHQAKR
jgi:hypothetical protein